MLAEVLFGKVKVGELNWEKNAYGVTVSLDCSIPCDPLILLRCYGKTKNGPFLIGLPEPRHGRLALTRKLSRETLKEAGCLDEPPSGFYLSDSSSPPAGPENNTGAAEEIKPEAPPSPERSEKAKPIHTGDELLDKLLEAGDVQGKEGDGKIELRCPFNHDEPFALAHIFALCEVKNGEAILKWPL